MQDGSPSAATLGLALTLGIGLLGSPASAESGTAYGPRRAVDATGRWSVVLEAAARGAEFTFVEAPACAPPVLPLEAEAASAGDSTEVSVREGDTVLSTGHLEEAPQAVLVSSSGLGFAAIGSALPGGAGVPFAWVGREGAVTCKRRLEDLFPGQAAAVLGRLPRGPGWFRDAWVDDEGREVVVVAAISLLCAVSVDTGAVRQAGATEIRRAMALPDCRARAAALDLAREMRLADVSEVALGLLKDSSPAVRVRAAAALAERGDERGTRVLVALAASPRAEGVGEAEHGYALERLPSAIGVAAIPYLDAAMASGSLRAWGAAADGFAALGERAVPALLATLSEPGRSSDARGGSAYALGRIGSKAALPALLATVPDRDEYVAGAAAGAAIAIGKASASKDLAALLDTPTTQDGRLASYFGEVKEPSSVGPLVRCLARHPRDGYPRAEIASALAFQTGADLGDDASAWAAWLEKHPL